MSEARGGDGLGFATDLRTQRQRCADAQAEMARLAAAQLELRSPADPPRVVVHTTVEQLAQRAAAATDTGPTSPHAGPATCEQTGPLSSAVLQLLTCDAHLERVVLDRAGAVVRMQSAGRLANRAQRRALAARDGGCSWPGCAQPPTACEAHREQWTIAMRDGVPGFVPPEWLDPGRRPVRNSFHTAAAATRAAGAALVRGSQLPWVLLDSTGEPPPDPDEPP